jgi:hypothetical protein
MILRLLVTALDTERAARREVSPAAAQPPGGAGTDDDDVPGVLTRQWTRSSPAFPTAACGDILDRAIQIADGDWAWQFSDDEIIPAGVVVAALAPCVTTERRRSPRESYFRARQHAGRHRAQVIGSQRR